MSKSAASGHIHGHARVGATDQDVSIRDAALRAAGCTAVRAETVTGKVGQESVEGVVGAIGPDYGAPPRPARQAAAAMPARQRPAMATASGAGQA